MAISITPVSRGHSAGGMASRRVTAVLARWPPDVAVHTIQGHSLVRRAMDAVNTHIRDEALRVGDTLPGEGHFAEQLGVSRAVMREAFGALAALHLIDVGNGRRPRVAAIDGSVMATSLD